MTQSPQELSPELLELLEAKLDTFEKLELALALRAAGKAETLTELALELQVGREVLRRVAETVITTGIIEACDEDSLRLRSGPWNPLLDEAAAAYAADPRKLMRLYTRIAMQKIRGLSARTFADAFLLKKKDS